MQDSIEEESFNRGKRLFTGVPNLLFPNHQPGQFFGRPVGRQVRPYFLYLPIKKDLTLILWRRRRILASKLQGMPTNPNSTQQRMS